MTYREAVCAFLDEYHPDMFNKRDNSLEYIKIKRGSMSRVKALLLMLGCHTRKSGFKEQTRILHNRIPIAFIYGDDDDLTIYSKSFYTEFLSSRGRTK